MSFQHDNNASLNLNEFVEECRMDVNRFHEFWRAKQASPRDAEHYPESMPAGEWFEQFLMFMATGELEGEQVG